MMGFLVESAVKKYGLSSDGKIRIIGDLIGPLAALPDSMSRAVYIKDVAERLDVDHSAILERVWSSVPRKASAMSLQGAKIGSRLEEALIAMMLQSPEMISNFDAREIVDSMETATLKRLGKRVLDRFGADEIASGADLITQAEDPQTSKLISAMLLGGRSWDRESCLKIVEQYKNHLRKRQEKALLRRIKDAEKANNHALLNQLLEEKQKRARERLKTF
jgi:DNA primase